MQNKANLQDTEMSLSPSITNYYENIFPFIRRENKPKQTQRCVCPSPAFAAKHLPEHIFLCEDMKGGLNFSTCSAPKFSLFLCPASRCIWEQV